MGTGNGPMTDDNTTAGESRRETEELTQAIAQTRDEMGGTLEELHGRLNPVVLKDEALKQFHEAKETIKSELRAELSEAKEALKTELSETKQQLYSDVKSELSEAKTALRDATIGKVENMVHNTQETVRTTSRSVVNTIKENPVPAALIGVGLVWLIANSRSRKERDATYGGAYLGGRYTIGTDQGDGREGSGRVSQVAHRAAEAVGEATVAARDRLSHLASDARSSVTDAAQATSEQVSRLAHSAADQSRRLGHQAEDSFASHPLAMGAALFAVGAAVGIAVPTSRRENQLMGSARDQMLERAGELAHEARGKVEEAARQLTDTAQSAGAEMAQSLRANQSGSAANGGSSQARGGSGHHPQSPGGTG